jgi:hypothetical protein
MAFTGKATYSAGITLPELAEDVADIVGIISPVETHLLDAIGNPLREARSTYHEWLEDSLVPNKDAISDSSISDPDGETSFDVANGDRFRTGDQIQTESSEELMLVTGVSGNTITVVRGYAGTTPENITDGQVIKILGNAALEGDDKPAARFTNRIRCGNYTQIFTNSVEVSGTNVIWVFQTRWIIRRVKGCASWFATLRTPLSTAVSLRPIRRVRVLFAGV